MMVAKLNNEIIYASNKIDRNYNFICHDCNGKLILKSGLLKVSHFAHSTKCKCLYIDQYINESERHKLFKINTYKLLKLNNFAKNVFLEHKLHNRIADLYFEHVNGNRFVIEIQHSPITLDEFIKRTRDYNKQNIIVMWIFDKNLVLYDNNEKNSKNIATRTFFRNLIFKNGLNYFFDDDNNIQIGELDLKHGVKYRFKKAALKTINIKSHYFKVNDEWVHLKCWGFDMNLIQNDTPVKKEKITLKKIN